MPLTEPSSTGAFYPVGLNLAGKTVLVVGAGTVAARKVRRLLSTGCRLVVVSPELSPGFRQCLAEAPAGTSIHVIESVYEPTAWDTWQPALVMACTNDLIVNRQIAADAQARGTWVNSVTEGVDLSDFIVPSVITYDALQVALFSGGQSPLFIRRLRQQLEETLGSWVGPYLALLGEVRQAVQARYPHDESLRKCLLEAVLSDEALLDAVQQASHHWEETRPKLVAQALALVENLATSASSSSVSSS